MNALTRKGTALLLSSTTLFLTGLWVGHRLTRDHYQGVLARQELRFTAEHEAAAHAHIEAEHRAAKALAQADQRYQQEIEREKAQHRRTLAELDTTRRLYIGIRPTADHCGGLSAPAPTSSGDHDPARAELSSASARFLVQLAFEADQVVRQLTACQNMVRADREVLGDTEAAHL